MSAVLHLGELVQPYELYGQGRTTGDVGGYLEAKYGIMQTFWDRHGQQTANDLASAVGDEIEAIMAGAPAQRSDLFATAMSKTGERFKAFLSSREVERSGIPGVPTKAALRGVSHRKMHPYRKRGRRPSFIDSGLFEASFMAWMSGWQR
ncbi:MAG: hypothetical protein ACRESI_06505 [Gammaproteobacteria bacterium]